MKPKIAIIILCILAGFSLLFLIFFNLDEVKNSALIKQHIQQVEDKEKTDEMKKANEALLEMQKGKVITDEDMKKANEALLEMQKK